MNGYYGQYGQAWDIPAQLLDRGVLGSYTSGCTSCSAGLGFLHTSLPKWVAPVAIAAGICWLLRSK